MDQVQEAKVVKPKRDSTGFYSVAEVGPPKDGTWLLVRLYDRRDTIIKVLFDPAWGGGRGSWFNDAGRIVDPKTFYKWKKA